MVEYRTIFGEVVFENWIMFVVICPVGIYKYILYRVDQFVCILVCQGWIEAVA